MSKRKSGNLENLFNSKQDDGGQEIKASPTGFISTRFIFSLPVSAKRQFDILSAEEGQTKQKLMIEALNDLFEKYGKARIA